jgi:hypothetical protein
MINIIWYVPNIFWIIISIKLKRRALGENEKMGNWSRISGEMEKILLRPRRRW